MTSNGVRQRHVAGSGKKKDGGVSDVELDEVLKSSKNSVPAPAGSETEYKVAFGFITALAFLTRFWGITHPNEVVFDEVHFGKVCRLSYLDMFLVSSHANQEPVLSSPHITSRGPTSSTSILPSASFYSPSWDG
jgi:hypothetical protein